MITNDNFKALLKYLNFQENALSNEWNKDFPQTKTFLKVDFDKNQLIYPEYTNKDDNNPNGMIIDYMIINERVTVKVPLQNQLII